MPVAALGNEGNAILPPREIAGGGRRFFWVAGMGVILENIMRVGPHGGRAQGKGSPI